MKVFVGSSSESKRFAGKVANALKRLKCEVKVWFDYDTFPAGKSTIEALDDLDVDAAILVFGKDDKLEENSKSASKYVVRDNVIFEFGFFAGKLGLKNVAYIQESEGIHIPTDLSGIIRIRWEEYTLEDNINDAWLKHINPKKPNKNTHDISATQNVSVENVYTAPTDYNTASYVSSNVNNKANNSVQFTFFGVPYYESSQADAVAKIIEFVINRYPHMINNILQSPIVSTVRGDGNYFRTFKKINVNGMIYYVGTSTGKDAKKSQLKNIFRSIGIEPTPDVITFDGSAL